MNDEEAVENAVNTFEFSKEQSAVSELDEQVQCKSISLQRSSFYFHHSPGYIAYLYDHKSQLVC